MFSRLLLAALVASVINAGPLASDRKCVPIQHEMAVLGKVAQDNKGTAQVVELVGTLSADYKAKKVAFIESVYFEGKAVGKYTYLRTESASYMADSVNKKCTKMPPQQMVRYCTDTPSLKYITSMSVGSEMVDVYDFEENNKKVTATMLRSTFTPVSEVVEQEFAGLKQMLALSYGNLTLGIKDASVFKVPSYC